MCSRVGGSVQRIGHYRFGSRLCRILFAAGHIRQQQGKGAAKAHLTFHVNLSTEQRHEFQRNAQSESGTFLSFAAFDAGKGLENAFAVVAAQSAARVAYGQVQPFGFAPVGGQFHLTLLGIFNGVAQQVFNDLAQAEGIGADEQSHRN